MSLDPTPRGSLPGASAPTAPEAPGISPTSGPSDVDPKVRRPPSPDGPDSTLPYLEMALTQGDEAWIDEIARAISAPEDSAERADAREAPDVSGSPTVTARAEHAKDAEHVEPAPEVEIPVPETPAPFFAPPLVTRPAGPEPLPGAASIDRDDASPAAPSHAGRWQFVTLALGLLAIVGTLFVLYLRSHDAGAAGATARAAEPASRASDAGALQAAPPAPAAAATGRLVLAYTGTRVFVGGTPDSRSPVVTYDLPPGDHEIRLETPAGTVRRTVRITAGQETRIPLDSAGGTAAAKPTLPAAPSTGWLRVSAPVEMQMFEGERFLGTTRVDRMLIEAGAHDVTLVAEGIGYRATHRVTVRPGATTSLGVTLPPGRLSVNAVPWANVFIDGQPAGETPIGNLEVSSGPHEIRLVHPTLGEVTRTLVVKVGEPARLGVDMRKK